MDWVDVEMELSAGGREDLSAWVHDNAVNCRAMADLLATIHRDGGHHTASVGLAQSCKDAESVVYQLMSDSAMATNDAKIVTCLFRYIDRMNDVCDEDPADTILREFVADVMPLISERIRKRSDDHEAQKA